MNYIYKITNLVNNKIYIGQTIDPDTRWKQHRLAAKNNPNSQVISRAINKHNIKNFKFEVISSVFDDGCDDVEVDIISQYNATDKSIGYNVALGGKKHILSEETKKKMSKSSMGKPGTNNGKKFSNEHRRRMSNAAIGRVAKSTRRFSDEEENNICEMYKTGRSGHSIAKELGCAKTTIMFVLERNNVQLHDYGRTFSTVKKKFSPDEELDIYRLYNEGGVSLNFISDKFNASIHTISKIVKRNMKDQNGKEK